ncbi:hypothetical protein PSHT_06666 [Puccinia striiformis]|uniref:Uncharacterized protein n=2 Tax=Puccinia striiformis TaxID=27350 RepID=A0A2S4UQL9_9BASI|nr:hypothetical protein PSTT_13786 [Puccinia striiformis]POW16755.1 hypothetical protein PSHT_06666 [Puccinia striiformis]
MQHNCHLGECPITPTKAVRVERQEPDNFSGEVIHTDEENFVAIPLEPLPYQTQLAGLHEGLAKWHTAGTKSGPPGPIQAIDPCLE